MKSKTLLHMALECREIVLRARKSLGEDLGGYPMHDLLADSITEAFLADLRAARVMAGVGYEERGRREARGADGERFRR